VADDKKTQLGTAPGRTVRPTGGAPVAVLNQGISGDKVLSDRMGVNALARFDRDVLSQPKADTAVLMMGINDIGWPGCGLAPNDREPTADEIIAGYRQLIARAHAHNFRILGATLTPFGDAFKGTPFEGYYTDDKEKIRVAVNEFIRMISPVPLLMISSVRNKDGCISSLR